MKDISYELSNPFSFSIDRAINKTIGISGYEIYENWKNELINIYDEQLKNIDKEEKNYNIIANQGTTNIHPIWSYDGNRIRIITTRFKQ